MTVAAPAWWRRSGEGRIGRITAGVGSAAVVRRAIGGSRPSSDLLAGAVFAGLLALVAIADGWRPGRLRTATFAWGAFGGAVLLSVAALPVGVVAVRPQAPIPLLTMWAVVVVAIATSEELVLRGTLFARIARTAGELTAVATTAALFAILHVPLYGWRAVPLDLAVGLWLGGLRLASGTWAAAAVAHASADLATGWVVW